MRTFALITVLVLGGLLFYATPEFPPWGDPESPASLHVSPYYIEHSMEDTAVPNVVTAVLADYRGYDTMFETSVIFSAGIACLFLLPPCSYGCHPADRQGWQTAREYR